MKKVIFALAAVVALAACSKEETVSFDKGAAIGFDTFVENSTRSEYDPSYTNTNMFNDFAVFGYVEGAVLFNGVRVAQENLAEDQTKTGWEYEGTQYWIAGAQYNFNAVAPMTDGGWTKTAASAESTTLSFTNNGTTDLLYATAAQEGKVSGNTVVGFNFRHVLSKVKFSFENAYNATNATIRVKDVKINDAYASGVATLNANTAWVPTADSNDLTLSFGNAATTAVDAEQAFGFGTTVESYKELLMIPGAGATSQTINSVESKVYTITFDVVLLVSEQEVATYKHTIYTTFAPQAGMSYNLKAVINATNIDPNHAQEPIEFTVNTLPGWDTETTVGLN